MPIKQVVCSVCNQTVNKAQTYFVGGDKRACKSHEGVVEKRDTLAAKKVADAERVKEKLAFREKRDENLNTNYMKPHCWICGEAGLRQQEFFMRVLVERAKGEKIYGLVNPLDLSHPANQHGIKERCIFVIDKSKAYHLIPMMRPDLRGLPDFCGVFSICAQCAKKHNIEVLPKVEFDELIRFSAVTEVFIKPVIDAIATSEMTRDQ